MSPIDMTFLGRFSSICLVKLRVFNEIIKID